AGEEEANQAVLRSSASRSIIRRPLQRGFARRVTLARVPALMPWSTTAHLVSCGRFDTCRRSTLSCWRSTRISATSFVLGGLSCRPTHVCAENQILAGRFCLCSGDGCLRERRLIPDKAQEKTQLADLDLILRKSQGKWHDLTQLRFRLSGCWNSLATC